MSISGETPEWHRFIINTIEYGLPEDYVIWWIYDELRNMRTSELVDVLKSNYGAFVTNLTNERRAMQALRTHIKSTNAFPPVVVLDLMELTDFRDAYIIMNLFKDCRISNNPHTCFDLRFPESPIVIAFSSSPPNLNAYSHARWNLHIGNYSGNSFAFTFESPAARSFNDALLRVEQLRYDASKKHNIGITYRTCNPFGIRLGINVDTDTNAFKAVTDYLTAEKRRSYWSCHTFPEITASVSDTRQCLTEDVAIAYRQMTEDEALAYDTFIIESSRLRLQLESHPIKLQ